MDAHLRIPTKEQYAYIEAEVEGTPAEIVDAYINLTALYKKKQIEADTKEITDKSKAPF